MKTGILKYAIYLFIAVIFFSGMAMAQEKNKDHRSNINKTGHVEQALDSTSFDLKVIDENKDGKLYQCPMDYEILSDKTGECTECGMKLKEVSMEKAADNLIKNGYSVEGSEEESSIESKKVIDLKAIDANKDGMVYQDMMDYHVIFDTPGSCPLCGMTLNEVSLEKAKMYLEKSGYKVK